MTVIQAEELLAVVRAQHSALMTAAGLLREADPTFVFMASGDMARAAADAGVLLRRIDSGGVSAFGGPLVTGGISRRDWFEGCALVGLLAAGGKDFDGGDNIEASVFAQGAALIAEEFVPRLPEPPEAPAGGES